MDFSNCGKAARSIGVAAGMKKEGDDRLTAYNTKTVSQPYPPFMAFYEPFAQIDPEILQAIGELSIAVNMMEEALSYGLAFLSKGNTDCVMRLLENSSFAEKFRAYNSLVEYLKNLPTVDAADLEAIGHLKSLLRKADKVNSFRNQVVHARMKVLAAGSGSVVDAHFGDFSKYVRPKTTLADKHGNPLGRTPTEVRLKVKEAKVLAEKFVSLTAEMSERIFKDDA